MVWMIFRTSSDVVSRRFTCFRQAKVVIA